MTGKMKAYPTFMARILGPQDGEHAGKPGVLHDRFLIDAHETEGRFAVVEHLLPARALAAPLHFKPRGQWHTFWNAGDTPARILEIISPGGFEQAFRDLDELGGELTPEAVAIIGQRFSVDIDFEGTGAIAERHALTL